MPRPAELPLLKAIAWQRTNLERLTPEEMLSLYERNWRMRGVLADPSPAELLYVRELARFFHSDLSSEL